MGVIERFKNYTIVKNIIGSGFYTFNSGHTDKQNNGKFIDIVSYIFIFSVAFTSMYTGYAYTKDSGLVATIFVSSLMLAAGFMESIICYFTISAFYHKRYTLGLVYALGAIVMLYNGVYTTSFTLKNAVMQSDASAMVASMMVDTAKKEIAIRESQLTAESVQSYRQQVINSKFAEYDTKLIGSGNNVLSITDTKGRSASIMDWRQHCTPEANERFKGDSNCSSVLRDVRKMLSDADNLTAENKIRLNGELNYYRNELAEQTKNIGYKFDTYANNKMVALLGESNLNSREASLNAFSWGFAWVIEVCMLGITGYMVFSGRAYPFAEYPSKLEIVDTLLSYIRDRMFTLKARSQIRRIKDEIQLSGELAKLEMMQANLSAVSKTKKGIDNDVLSHVKGSMDTTLPFESIFQETQLNSSLPSPADILIPPEPLAVSSEKKEKTRLGELKDKIIKKN